MEKLTDAEIKKALECCCVSECDECPYDEQTACVEMVKDGAFVLINRQKAEIERLKLENLQMVASIKRLKDEAYREFGHLLIDKSENGVIHTMDIPDYVKELTEVPDINDGKRGDRCYE